jgi:hypothetical protein
MNPVSNPNQVLISHTTAMYVTIHILQYTTTMRLMTDHSMILPHRSDILQKAAKRWVAGEISLGLCFSGIQLLSPSKLKSGAICSWLTHSAECSM